MFFDGFSSYGIHLKGWKKASIEILSIVDYIPNFFVTRWYLNSKDCIPKFDYITKDFIPNMDYIPKYHISR